MLIVEDDRDLRETLVEVLEDKGVVVASAPNGLEALLYLHGAKVLPRLILLDLMMPVMDGRQFRFEQMEVPAWRAVPVYLMTAHGNFKDERELMSLDGALAKPLQLKELFAVVARYRP